MNDETMAILENMGSRLEPLSGNSFDVKAIVTNLFKTTNPYFCPHKRPVIVDLTLEEIEKRMKRK